MQNLNAMTRQPRRKTVFKRAHILIIEDRRINQNLMMKILDDLGCSSDSAFNAAEGIAKIKQHVYDLVFMDCHMPVMDTFEATRQIRQAETAIGRPTTIIALTDDGEKCLKAGMDDYLKTPFRIEQIADMLNKWIVSEDGKD